MHSYTNCKPIMTRSIASSVYIIHHPTNHNTTGWLVNVFLTNHKMNNRLHPGANLGEGTIGSWPAIRLHFLKYFIRKTLQKRISDQEQIPFPPPLPILRPPPPPHPIQFQISVFAPGHCSHPTFHCANYCCSLFHQINVLGRWLHWITSYQI